MNKVDYNSEECLSAFNLVQSKLSRKDRCRFISNQMDTYIKEKSNYYPTDEEKESLFATYKLLEKLIKNE